MDIRPTISWLSIRCSSSVDQVSIRILIEYRLRCWWRVVNWELIEQHSTTGALSTYNPKISSKFLKIVPRFWPLYQFCQGKFFLVFFCCLQMLENITMIFSSYILNVISSFPYGMHASKARINSLMHTFNSALFRHASHGWYTDIHFSLGPTNNASELRKKCPLPYAQPWAFYTQLSNHICAAELTTEYGDECLSHERSEVRNRVLLTTFKSLQAYINALAANFMFDSHHLPRR